MSLKEVLDYRTVAVVGCSRDPTKEAHRIPKYLLDHGYLIVPINPSAKEILGRACYPSLLEMPEELQKNIEVVNIFRPSGDVPPIVEQAIELKKKHGNLKAIWMQLGIVNDEAAEKAKGAGLKVVMDQCMMLEHARLCGRI